MLHEDPQVIVSRIVPNWQTDAAAMTETRLEDYQTESESQGRSVATGLERTEMWSRDWNGEEHGQMKRRRTEQGRVQNQAEFEPGGQGQE